MRVFPNIERSGYFWLPSNPDQKVPGQLSIADGGKIQLKTLGLFDSDSPQVSAHIGRVHGQVEGWGLVTLDACFYRKRKVLLDGLAKAHIHANFAFVGAHFLDASPLTFDQFHFSVEGLDDWVGLTGIKIQNDLHARSTNVSYEPLEEVSIALKNGFHLVISFHWQLPGEPATNEAKISQKAYLKLIAPQATALADFIALSHQITTLLCVAMDRTVCLTEASGLSKKITLPQRDGRHLAVPIKLFYQSLPFEVMGESTPPAQRSLFQLGHIHRHAETLLNQWLQSYAALEPALNLYFAARSGSHRYLDSHFLALAQALETLHRRISSEVLMDEPHFLALKEQLLASCPVEHQKWLHARLAHGNELPLTQRLKSLFSPFKEYLGTNRDRNQLIGSIAATRNYLTHYDPAAKERAVTGPDLLPLCLKMEALLQLQLLKLLGFSANEIQLLIQKSRDLQRKLGYRFS